MKDIIILIPAYKPNKDIMLEFINELKNRFENIVIVDDGSGEEFNEFFNHFESDGIRVIHHEINCGKGRAIKTGFDFILKNYNNYIGTITADCDGQHTVKDIEKCAEKLREYPKALVIGCRNFNEQNVPPKSRYGNKITRLIFNVFVGINITDTQSGLRGFGIDLMKLFLNTDGERYEYETNMLIECKKQDITIQEVTIETVYLDNNQGSHFNPIKDSLKIYHLFFKYIMSSFSSFILDILIFSVCIYFINIDEKIIVSTIIARVISLLYNFTVNAKLVFNKCGKASIVKYLILAIIQMMISGYTVTFITNAIHVNEILTKIIVDTTIFVVNFVIQREWVFKTKNRIDRK